MRRRSSPAIQQNSPSAYGRDELALRLASGRFPPKRMPTGPGDPPTPRPASDSTSPSFLSKCSTWLLMVPTPTPRARAISALVCPLASRSRTSRSRGVSRASWSRSPISTWPALLRQEDGADRFVQLLVSLQQLLIQTRPFLLGRPTLRDVFERDNGTEDVAAIMHWRADVLDTGMPSRSDARTTRQSRDARHRRLRQRGSGMPRSDRRNHQRA